MEAHTIENGEIFITECSRVTEHEAHTWYEGFLGWRGRRTCKGLTKEWSDKIRFPKKPPHKHFLRIHMYPEYPFINPNKVVGHCSGCGTWCSVDKVDFYDMLLGNYESYSFIKAEADGLI